MSLPENHFDTSSLSIQEAARILKVSEKTLRRWEDRGILEPLRTSGGHRRYSYLQLQEFKKHKKAIERGLYTAPVSTSVPYGETVVPPSVVATTTTPIVSAPLVETSSITHSVSTHKQFSLRLPAFHLPTVSFPSLSIADLRPALVTVCCIALLALSSLIVTSTPSVEFAKLQTIALGFQLPRLQAPRFLVLGNKAPESVQMPSVILGSTALEYTRFSLNVDTVLNENFRVAKDATISGSLTLESGQLLTSATSASIFPSIAQLITIGSATSTTTVGGDLTIAGNTLSTPGDLVIDPGGGAVLIGDSTPGSIDSAAGDLFVSGDIELDGTLYAPNAQLTTATIGTLSLNGDSFTDLTGTGLLVSNGSLQTSLGTSIASSELEDGSIAAVDVKISGTAANGALLSYNSATGGFSWGDGASLNLFTDGGDVTYLTATTDDLTVGSTLDLAKLGIDGDSDEIQFLIQGNSTQTANYFVIEASDGTDVLTINSTGSLNLSAGQDLSIGGIGLNDIGSSNTTSGAALIGVYDEFNNSNGTTIQDVLDDFDSAMGSGASKWTDSGTLSYLTATTDDVAIGGSTLASSFSVNVASNLVRIGTGATADATLSLYSANGDTGSLSYNTSDQFVFSGGNVLVSGQLLAGSTPVTLTTATGYLDADALQLITADGTGSTGSASGLEVDTDRIGLLQGCSDGQVLKWNNATSLWECGTDTGASFAVVNVENNDVAVGTNVDSLDFNTEFSLVASPSNEANISIANDAVDLGTQTVGNYVASVSEGTAIDITGSAGEGWTPTVAFDSTELGTTTFGSGSGIVWTFDVGATDPTLTFASDALTITAGATAITGNLDVSGTFTSGTANAFQVDASGNLNTTGTLTAATNETINGIDISTGTVSDVVNLTINAGGDLTIGTIGLNDVGTDNITSGASLVGVFDEFGNSASTTVQDVLDDLDAAITAGAAGDISSVTAGSGLTGGGASGDVTLDIGAGTGISVVADSIALDFSAALSGDHTLASNESKFGQSGLIFEGLTANTIETYFSIADATTTDKTITFPDLTGTVLLSGHTFTGDVTATLGASNTTALTISADSVALGTDTTGNYVANVTGTNGISVSGTAGEGWTAAVELASTTAGNGLTFTTGVLDVGAGNGITVATDSVAVDQAYAFVWTTDHTYQQADPTVFFNDTTASAKDYYISVDADNFVIANNTDGRNDILIEGTGRINIGDNTTGKTIDIAGVNSSAADTVNIATNGTAADIIAIGNNNAATTLALTGGDDWSISTAGAIVTTGTISAATDETINGIDINTGTVTDVVNITVNSGGDLTIGAIGLNDVGTTNITSGASLVGVFDEFTNSASTTVQDVLDDLDAAIAGAGGDITSVVAGSGLTGGGVSGDVTLDIGAGTGISVVADSVALDFSAALSGDHTLAANESKFGVSGLIFEGATANTIETYIAVTDPTSSDKTITLPDLSGTVLLSGHTFTGDVTATLGASNTTALTIASDSVALGTDTTGNFVAGLTEGTAIDISGTAGEAWSPTVTFDSTELGTTTFGSGSGITWTFDVGATDPTLAFASDALTITAGSTAIAGNLDVSGTFASGTANAFQVDASGNLNTTGTLTAATNETINGIDISTGTVSDVVNLTINAGGDLTIGTIGLNDVGTDNITSGASLVGVFDELANSASTTVQDVLDDLDAAITAGAAGDISSVTAGSGLTGGGASGDVTLDIGAGTGISVAADAIAFDFSAALSGDHTLAANESKFGVSGLIFEGATANTIETYFSIADATSADKTITFPDLTGTVLLSGHTFTGDVTATLGASNTTALTIAADSVALGTDTTGNYVAGLTEGTAIDISGTAGEAWSPTVTFDSTELGTTTFGSGSGIVWTFDVGATDPTLTFGSDALTIAATSTGITGNLDVSGTLNSGTANAFQVDGSGNISTSGTLAVNGGTATFGSNGTDGSIVVYNELGATDYSVTLQPSASQTGSYSLTLPVDDGTSDYVLTTNGSGVLSWQSVTGIGAGTGDITTVGSMTTGDVFTDANADDDWLGLGASAGRIEFDDQATDEVNIIAANVGIGTQTPSSALHVAGATGITIGTDIGSGSSNIPGKLTLISNGDNAYSTVFQTGTQTQDVTYTLPTNDGSSNQVLITDGAGVLSWVDVTGIGGAGDITSVVAGSGLTGGGTAGDVTLDVGAGTAIDINADDIAWDSTEVGTTTYGSGSGITWTFDAGATDPTIAFASDSITLTGGTITAAGTLALGSNNLTVTGGTLSTAELLLLDGRSGTLVDSNNVSTYATTGVTAGAGLTGGGTVGALTVDIGAGTGIAVNANDISLDFTAALSGDHTLGANESKFGVSGLIFEGATANTIETYFSIADATTTDKTITFPDLTGTVILSGHTFTGDVTATLGASNTTALTIASDSVALGTDTTGNFVAGLTEGTAIDISGTAGEAWSPTVTFDSTELGTTTFGSGSGVTWTFDVGATDPTLAFASDALTITAGATGITGNVDVSGTFTSGTANAFQVDASGNLNTTGTLSAATNETLNGIDISTGTVSDVVNLTINAGGDLTIGTIGLNDVGTDNITSGASLVGVFDEFGNSASTTVQDVLDDLDAAITAGAAGDISSVTAGSGLTGGGASGDVTLDIGAGTGISVAADAIAFDFTAALSGDHTLAANESKFGVSGLVFEGATANTIETYLAVTDPTTTDKTITLPDLSGTVLLSGHTFTGDVTATLGASNTTALTIAADSVALGTDTTGNYVAGLTEGTAIDISGTAGEAWSPTVTFDSTELGTTTFGSGSGVTWTFDVGATDPTLAFASDALTITAGSTAVAGNLDVSGTLTSGTANAFQVDASGAITAATAETINGVDISAGTVSDVVNLTVNAGGDLTIGTIGLNDVGTDNITSGASLVGVFDEFGNSASTTVQDVLDDLDAAITAGAAGDISSVTAGSGLTGGGASGDVTLDIGAGTGISVAADAIAFDFTAALSGDHTLAANESKFGVSGLIFEGATANTIETYFSITDPTASDKTITFPDLTGTVLLSGHTFTGDVTATLGASNTTALTIASDSVALGTDTTGNYVAGLTEGTAIDVSGTPGEAWSPTVTFDSTELGTTTFGSGSGVTWTFDVGATDPTLAFATDALTITAGSTGITGNLDVSGTLTSGTGNAFQVDASGAITAATAETINGIDITTGTVSDVVNLTINTGGDLTIGAIGLNDVGTDNITSGASLVGTFDEFGNSASTTVQDVLDDLDASITTALAGDISSVTAGSGLTGGGASGDVTLDIGAGTGISVAADAIAFDFTAALSGDHTLAANESKFGVSGLVFEGATADTIETYIAVTDPTSSDKTITLPDLSGTVILSGHTFTGDVTATLGASNTTALTIASDSVALGTDTTGNFVAGLTEGTAIDISGTAGEAWSPTVTFDSTELGTTTFGSGSGIVWTFDVGATDPTLTFASDALTLTAATTSFSGDLDLADDNWIGLSSGAGLIEFDDQTTDEINFLNANVGIGTSTPGAKLDVNGTFAFYPNTQNSESRLVSRSIHSDGRWAIDIRSTTASADQQLANVYGSIVGLGEGEFMSTGMDAGLAFQTQYAVTFIPRLYIGGTGIGPNNVSYLRIDRSSSTEWTSGASYPSGSNYFIISSELSAPLDGSDNRAPLRIGGYDLSFYTGGQSIAGSTEKMKIDLNGLVGIGTSAPDKQLEINSATGANLRLTYNDSNGSATNYADFSTTSGGDLTIAPSGSDLAITGNVDTSGTLTAGTGDAFQVDASGAITAATAETINGIDITTGTVSDVVNLTINTGGDLTIGAIGLNDVGTDNITSGASLVGVFDEFANSASTTVQDVLDDLDAAIAGAGGDITSVVAGAGLTGGGVSGDVTLDIGAGTAIDINADDIAWDSTEVGTTVYGANSDFTWTFDGSGATDPTIAFASDAMTLTAGSITAAGNLTVSGTTGLTLSGVGGDITFANAEKIDNDTDGTVTITAPTTAVSGDLSVGGGDITTAGGENIDLGEATADTSTFYINSVAELALSATNLTAGAAEGNSLGSATTEWEQLFLGDDNGIAFGLDQDWTIGYDETTDDRLELVTAGTSGMLIQSATATGTGLATTFNALSSGTGIALSSTSTALTSGSLASVDWSPGSATTASGDLFRVNIGTNGTTTGNLFDIEDTGSSLFSVSETAITANLPTSFTAAGDVSMAYDLLFTNQTAAYIKSYGPLILQAGESFENNNLALQTYGTGNAVFDFQGTGDVVVNSADPNIIFDSKTATDTDFWLGVQEDAGADDDDLFQIGDGTTPGSNAFLTINTSGNVGIGTTGPDGKLDVLATSGSQLRLTYADGSTYTDFTTDTNGDLTIAPSGSDLAITGNVDISGTLTSGTGNAFQVDASGAITAATAETINGVDISAGTVSDVVNLTINTGGDLTIGAIGLNDVGTDNITSGASLIGVYDEFTNSNATTVQDVLDDLDALITGGTGDITSVVAGAGLTDGGITGDVTLNIGAGTAMDINADDIAWDSTEVGTTTYGANSDFTWTFDGSGVTDPTIAFASNAMTLTAGTITAAGNLTVSGTTGLTLSGVGGDITFANAEKIDNDTDGTVLITAPTTSTSGNLSVAGTTGLTFTGVGGDITFTNAEKIDNDTDGTVTITAPTTSLSGDLTVTGGDITTAGGENIDLGEATADTSTFYINSVAELALSATNLTAGAAEGNSLGSATTEWEQLFLGDDNGIAFGLDQDWTFGYDETTDDRLELVTAGTSGMLIQSATATGTGLALNMNALSSGTGLSLSSTSTALTSGFLATVDWSPGSATSATGDLFKINIGANGSTSGNLFNITDAGSSLFSVSEAAITANLPATFTAAGDVSLAYDLQFTNQTASYIKSKAPLYIEAGESFESNDLTLRSYNAGDIIMDLQGTGFFQVINQSTSVTGTTTTDLNVAGAYINSTDLDTISLLVRNSNAGAITMQNVGTAGAQGDPGVFTVEGAGSSTTAYNLITAYNSLTRSDAASVFRVRADGTVYGEAAFQTTGADLAEYFEKEGELPTNEVVGINYETGKVRRFQAGDKLLGVTSNRAGFVGNYPKGKTDEQIAASYALVGFTGQLDVKLDDAEGPIRPGDPLRPSTQTGRATKANKPGYIIGYALEAWTPGSGDRDVLTYVNPSFADPTMALDNQGQMVADGLAQLASNPDAEANKTLIRSIAASLSEIVETTNNVFSTLIAGNIQSSTIQTDTLTVGGKSLQNVVLDTITENGFLVAKTDKIETREASISGILTAAEATISGNLTAKNITEMADRLISAEASISSLLSQDSTMSAQEKDSLLATLNPEIKLIVSDMLSDSTDWSTEASSSADVITADAVFASEYLNVQGTASITNANINNALIVGGSLALDKNSINLISDTESTLYVQATGTGTLDFLAGALTLNRDGGLVVTTDALFTQDVTVQGELSATTIAPESNILGIQLTASESSTLATESGKLAIKSGENEVASIDASGSATFAKLTLTSPETATGSASTASTGKAVLKQGQTDVSIYTTQVSADSLIYITPTSSTNNQVLYVSGKQAQDETTVGGFTVTLDQALTKDVEFNWWIIN